MILTTTEKDIGSERNMRINSFVTDNNKKKTFGERHLNESFAIRIINTLIFSVLNQSFM